MVALEKRSLTVPISSEKRDTGEAESFIFKSNVKIWLACICVFITIVALLFCYSQVRFMQQQVVNQQRDIEQAWVDSTLESVRNWHGKLVELSHYLSQAEAFRLFVMDLQDLSDRDLKQLSTKAVQEDLSHPMHSLAEEMRYLGVLLQETVGMRGWVAGRIVNANGVNLIAPQDAVALTDAQRKLLRYAAQTKSMAYSSIRKEGEKLVLDLVDPLYEVLGDASPKTVGFLLLTVPMDDALADFLAENKIMDASYRPSFLAKGQDGISGVQMINGKPTLVALHESGKDTADWPFARRMAVTGNMDVWSLGGHMSAPLWYVLMERSAPIVEDEIFRNGAWIYGVGLLVSLGVSLLVFIFVNQAYFKRRANRAQRCIEGLVHGIECALDGQDSKSSYLQGRSQKIDRISALIGHAMRCSDASLETMRLAARLSQVGKIFVPRELMTKKGVFTNEERRQVQMAPFHAFNVLKGMLPENVATTIYQMGGKVVEDEVTGNIRDLVPDEMTQEARILMVANDFCAMVSKRGTRAPLSYAEARQKLQDNKNYDGKVVAALQCLSDEDLQEVINEGEMSLEV